MPGRSVLSCLVSLAVAAATLTVLAPVAGADGLPCDTYTDVALGKTATASSVNAGQLAARAVDGNNNSKWGSLTSDPQWLQVDLGSTRAICSVTLLWANYATAFSLQVSDDATSWTTLTSAGATKSGSQSLPVSGSGRYLRMYGTARVDTTKGYELREFDVYSPANPQAPVFTSPATAAFTLGVHDNFSVTTQGVPAVTGITESGALPPGLRFTDGGDGTAAVVGTPTGSAGSYPVTLTASNGVSPDARQNLVIQVDRAPAVTSANTASFTLGSPGSFTVTTTGYPAPTITETGTLPSGLTFHDNGDGTATLAGSPTGPAGSSALTVTASNWISPNASQTLTVTVGQPPSFTSPTTATFVIGSAGSFTVTTTGYPNATITETGSLPSGLTFHDNGNGTASLSGTPTGNGSTHSVTLTASNGVSPDASQVLAVQVTQAPAFTSPAAATFVFGRAGSFTVTASGVPPVSVISLSGTLPAGVTFTDNGDGTATISGTPSGTPGTYPVTLVAGNGVSPNASQNLTIQVNQPPAFTSAASATFPLGHPGNFAITTSGIPRVTTIAESGVLPAGLTFTDHGDGTAAIAGTATGSVGSYPVTLTASNGTAPDATQALTIQVGQVGGGIQLTVTTTADVATNFGACGNSVQATPSGGSLREAVCAANNLGALSVTINIPGGHYVLSNGELAPGKVSGSNISIVGAGAASTILDGNHASRVLDIDFACLGGVTTSISGVTITNGTDSTFGGAGILAGSCNEANIDTLTISNSVISNNVANGSRPTSTVNPGGGLAMAGGTLVMNGDTVTGNSSYSSAGSGVYYQAFGSAAQSLTVSGSTFTGNSTSNSGSAGVSGGALAVFAGGPLDTPYTVSNSVFTGNTSTSSGGEQAAGAAIYEESGNLTVTGSTFTGNSVGGVTAQGGPILYAGGTATLHYDRLVGNTGTGGVLTNASGTVAASEDWWGCNTGPNTPGCETTSGPAVIATPRLVLTATATPSHVVGPNGTATVTASLLTDSAGAAVPAADLTAFDGMPVSFADPAGDATVGSAPGDHTVDLGYGVASIDYESNTTLGPDDDPVTLDDATVPATLEVDEAPAITSADHATFTVGTAGSFTVTTAAGYPTVTGLAESGALPSGVSFTDNGDGTATIAGTPTTDGIFTLTITAGNGVAPATTQTFTLTVQTSPVITLIRRLKAA